MQLEPGESVASIGDPVVGSEELARVSADCVVELIVAVAVCVVELSVTVAVCEVDCALEALAGLVMLSLCPADVTLGSKM